MISRAPIVPTRVRRIVGSFSWVDHRILSQGFLAAMAPEEILLYFFLVLVGDKNGISFYSYDKICAFLKMDVDRFIVARNRLIKKSLIASENGRFQVLQLPERGYEQLPARQTPRLNETKSLAEIFRNMANANHEIS